MLFIKICSKLFWLKQFYITGKRISTEGLMMMDVYRRNNFVLLWMSLTFIQEIYGKLAVVWETVGLDVYKESSIDTKKHRHLKIYHLLN